MGYNNTSVTIRTYYKTMKDRVRNLLKETEKEYKELLVEEQALYDDIKNNYDDYLTVFKVNLKRYPDFVNNSYSNDDFLFVTRNIFMNRKGNYRISNRRYRLFSLAKQQKKLYLLKKDLDKYKAMSKITIDSYFKILKQYYYEVEKQLILKGYGYALEGDLGWLCINRCKVVQGQRKKLDFLATKRNKEALLAEGKRLWNKQEAEYAEKVGIDYKGVDYRKFINEEYCYEIPLINCRTLKGKKVKFKVLQDNRETKVKTEEEVLKECNNDVNKVCNLDLDIRKKLYMCLKLDNLLYLNFIRNEGQQSAHTPKANRKGG